MRYREFLTNKKNKKTLEVSPVMSPTSGATSQKINPLSTSSNVAVPPGTKQAQTGLTPQTSTTQQNQQEKPQISLKPGMNILQPALSKNMPIKVKSISGSGNEVELDTQKILGHNIKVKQPELMAVLNQLGNKK